MKKKRVNVYIDGFNLYYVLKHHIKKDNQPWEESIKWCNLKTLVQWHLSEQEELWEIYFFTADSWLLDTKKRGIIYQKALNHVNINIIKWKYSQISRTYISKMPVIAFLLQFESSKKILKKYLPKILKYKTYEEKRTDVNIAVKIVEDAFLDKYDTAIIMSGDSDIIPAIETVKRNFKDKNFTTLWLTGTKGQSIRNRCDTHISIWYKKMKANMLPYNISLKSWEKISIPKEWQA